MLSLKKKLMVYMISKDIPVIYMINLRNIQSIRFIIQYISFLLLKVKLILANILYPNHYS